jgi:hypothetical protein
MLRPVTRSKGRRSGRAVWLGALCCGLAVALGGCAGRPATDPVVEAGRAKATHALDAARYLPPDTSWLVAFPDLSRALGLLGSGARGKRQGALLERAVAASVAGLDHDLLSSEGQVEIGLDPYGPAGVAGFGPGRSGLVLFASLANPRRFKAAAYRYFHQRGLGLEPRVIEGVLVLASPDAKGYALAVRDSLVMVAVTAGTDDAGELASELARLEPSESLGASAPFRTATSGPRDAGDVLFYLDPTPWLRQQAGIESRWSGASFAQAATALELQWRKALAQARADGSSAERMVALDDEFRAARRALREDPTAERWRYWIASVGPLLVGLDALPNGLRAHGSLRLEAGSPLARLLRNRAAAPLLVRKLPERPALLLEIAVDPKMLGELGALAGLPLDDLAKELGQDLNRELEAAFDGQLGIAVLHDLELGQGPKAEDEAAAPRWAPLRYAAVLGVRDPARARALLGRLAKATGTAGWLDADPKDGQYLVKDHGQGPLTLKLDAHALVVSSDEGLAEILTGSGPTPDWHGTGHRLLRRLAMTEDTSLDLGLDLGLLALSRQERRPGEPGATAAGAAPGASSARPQPSTTPAGGAPTDASAAPALSPDAQSKLAELGEVERLIVRLRHQLERRRMERPVAVARRVGTVGLRARRTEDGLRLAGGWVVGAASISAMLESVVEELWPAEPQRTEAAEIDAYLGELSARRLRLQIELEAAHARPPSPP